MKNKLVYKQIQYSSLKGIFILILTLLFSSVHAQENIKQLNIEELTFEQMKQLTQDDLLQFSFEDLILLVKKFKLSSIEELYALLLNPSQSTASKMEEDVFNAPLATFVITDDELQKSGSRSIPEALRLAPGLIVREKTNGNYDVHIRGNDYIPPGSDISNSVNSTTLVMIDNRPVYNSFLGATFWENLPIAIEDIAKIEIIYGPSSALYGPNAVSGVIHFITKACDKEGVNTHVDVQAGNHNSKIAYGSISYSKQKIGVRVSANYQQMDRFQDTYYIPETDSYVSGDEVGEINEESEIDFDASSTGNDYSEAKEQGAVNLSVDYHPAEQFSLNYSGSYQNSTAQTSYMDIGSVIATRKSSTFSNSINMQAGKFDGHVSGIFGHLNAVDGLPGYEYDYTELNGKLAYQFNYKNLIIRPGVDANYASYSDEDYIDQEDNNGLLNGTVELGTVQGSLRLDYTAFDKLRIVGAWVQGYFYEPGSTYTGYQFSSSYKAGENTLFRIVASKSNTSPFVLDTYMNKTSITETQNLEDGTTDVSVVNYVGNKDLDPQEMKMFELGVRQKLMGNLQADISVFFNKSNDFSQLESDDVDMDESDLNNQEGVTIDDEIGEVTAETQMVQNQTVSAEQIGVTASLKYVLNKKFNASVFATYQHTTLDDFEVNSNLYYQGLTGNEAIDDIENNPVYLSIDHEYTPKFYGGANINFAPSKKWNFNTSLYAYSKQKTFYTVENDFKWIVIDAKMLCNLKASYQMNKWLKLYVNARNINNDTAREFMFTDKTGSSYLGGLQIKF